MWRLVVPAEAIGNDRLLHSLRSLAMTAIAMSCFGRFCSGADVYVGLQSMGQGGRVGVGIAPFSAPASDNEGAGLAKSMRSVIREDLLFERLFNVVEGGPAPEP